MQTDTQERIQVSIIVPVHDIPRDFLCKCMESLIGQTWENIEIIAVDDGSPGDCGDVLDEYASLDRRVRVIHQENSGVSAARNKGIDAAGGGYVIFVDGDDYIERDCVATVLGEIVRLDADVLYFQYYTDSGVGKGKVHTGPSRLLGDSDLGRLKHAALKGEDFEGLPAQPPWGKIIRLDFLNDLGIRFPAGISKFEDVIFNIYISEYVARAGSLDYPGYHYRLRSGSATRRFNPGIKDIVLSAFDEMYTFIKDRHGADPAFGSDLGYRAICLIGDVEDLYIFRRESGLTKEGGIRTIAEYFSDPEVSECVSYAGLKDFPSLKGKIRYLLIKRGLYRLYYTVASVRAALKRL